MLLQRFGEYLLDSHLIQPADLQRALLLQQAQAAASPPRHLLIGQALVELGLLDRQLLDQAITHRLVGLQTALQAANRQLEERVAQRTQAVERQLLHIRTTAEITQLALAAPSLNELLRHALELLAERFDYPYVAIFLTTAARDVGAVGGAGADLCQAAGRLGKDLRSMDIHVQAGSNSLIGWVLEHQQPRVEQDLVGAHGLRPDGVPPNDLPLFDLQLPELRRSGLRSSCCLPVITGHPVPRLLGVLDLGHTSPGAFDDQTLAVLQTVANHLAAVIENASLLETTRLSLNQVSGLYQASYQMARAASPDEVLRITIAACADALKQSTQMQTGPSAGLIAFFMPDGKSLRRMVVFQPVGAHGVRPHGASPPGTSPRGGSTWGQASHADLPVAYPDHLPISADELDQCFIPGESILISPILPDTPGTHPDTPGTHPDTPGMRPDTPGVRPPTPPSLPEALLAPLRIAGYRQLALIPSRRGGRLEIVFLLATRQLAAFPQNTLQSYASLAEITSASLDKVYTAQLMEKRLMALQSLNAISQAVSVETDLMRLYQVIHREVISVIGNVSFAVATYDAQTDTIEVPYLFEGDQLRSVERFPAGEGLTSIIIRTRQPMLLVDDTERKTRQLGAKIVGRPAKSWLGVPLLMAGEAIGAIILQDLEREGRFDEDDQRLLTTLASQVAVAIRNARLLESTYRQAARERRLYEITKKIRSSPDIPGIMQSTAQELSKILGTRRATIELGFPESDIGAPPSVVGVHGVRPEGVPGPSAHPANLQVAPLGDAGDESNPAPDLKSSGSG
jgi:GAF domain-containing protein